MWTFVLLLSAAFVKGSHVWSQPTAPAGRGSCTCWSAQRCRSSLSCSALWRRWTSHWRSSSPCSPFRDACVWRQPKAGSCTLSVLYSDIYPVMQGLLSYFPSFPFPLPFPQVLIFYFGSAHEYVSKSRTVRQNHKRGACIYQSQLVSPYSWTPIFPSIPCLFPFLHELASRHSGNTLFYPAVYLDFESAVIGQNDEFKAQFW